MIRVKVPATSANLGSGFDSLGISLSMYNNIWIEEYDSINIISKDGKKVPKDKSNLIYRSANRLYEICGKKLLGLKIEQENNIPMARGLGSSAACIVAGLLVANMFLGNPMPKQELINLGAEIEGHPDNIAPAFLGGLVASAVEDNKVYNVSLPVDKKIRFAVFIPPFELRTTVSRGVLPQIYSKEDSVYNLSRAALMVASLCLGKFKNLRVSVQDKLHQPYRMVFIEGAETVFRVSYELGSYGTYITGAGPSIVAIIDEKNIDNLRKNAIKSLEENGIVGWGLEILKPDSIGASIKLV